jgi:hypothetical protein
LGFNSPTSYWFCQKNLFWWGKYVIEKINPKSWECIFNFCTYLVITLSLKIGKCIFTKWKKEVHIHLVKCVLNFSYVVYPYVIIFWRIFYIDNLNSALNLNIQAKLVPTRYHGKKWHWAFWEIECLLEQVLHFSILLAFHFYEVPHKCTMFWLANTIESFVWCYMG